MLLITLLALLQGMPAQKAKPGTVMTFRNWVVGCDNGRRCKAVALGPEAGEFPAVVIAVERDAGPAGAVRLHLSGEDDYAGPVALRIDGRTVASGGVIKGGEMTLDGEPARRAAEAMAAGARAEVLSGGARLGTVSLAGASAALRYMDAEQGRAGTTSALVARGSASSARVPVPALPVVRRAAAAGQPAALPPALIRQMQDMAACRKDAAEMSGGGERHALDRGRTLVIFPCQLGAYNSVEAIFIVEGGRARPAPFDSDVSMSDNDRVPSLINSGYAEGVLGGFGKGRGLGDCGIRDGHVWDGARFRLVDKAEMPACRGTRELIQTWRAEVR